MEKQYDIFISYSKSLGADYAASIEKRIAKGGYRVWAEPRDFRYGRAKMVSDAIKKTSLFILILTPDYISSHNLRQEYDLAQMLQKPIIAIVPHNESGGQNANSFENEALLFEDYWNNKLPLLFSYSLEDDSDTKDKKVANIINNYIIPLIGKPAFKNTMFGFLKYLFSWFRSLFKDDELDLTYLYQPQTVDCDIFISYRRKDGLEYARNIQLALMKEGYENIFFDYESIQNGEFKKRILDAIFSCKDFIIVLSPNSMKRCGKKGDPVANEIRAALKYKKNIIPVTIDNKTVKWPRSFPDDLEVLKELQFHDLKTDKFFNDSIDKMCAELMSDICD